MAVRSLSPLFLLHIALAFPSGSSAASTLCPRLNLPFLPEAQSQCPLEIEPSPPLEVTSETLEKELSIPKEGVYYSVLFYASWCPFSSNFWPIFNVLSSMFPNIKHLAIEQSSAMPSVFSRYGVHSSPAILLANGTSFIRYDGPKDLDCLSNFYQEATDLEPVAFLTADGLSNPKNAKSVWVEHRSPKEFIIGEPYLVFSLCFVMLKAVIYVFPTLFSRLREICVLHVWRPNLAIIGESSQLLRRLAQIADVKRVWSDLRLSYRTRNLRKGAMLRSGIPPPLQSLWGSQLRQD